MKLNLSEKKTPFSTPWKMDKKLVREGRHRDGRERREEEE